ncbi:hypothetical protein MNB_SV-5-1795 [hydrothermal vent metagenome]|uniref:DUF4136 domain-containing protein n=1 Tax=hydrothermal vent metagenome TaxID=652676 RepID=A0A1W1EE25_9ZZZZ
MIKLFKVAFIALGFFALTACVSTSDIKVESTKSEKVDLDGYTKYQFLEGSGFAEDTSKDKLKKNKAASAEMEEQINTVLMKKGKVPVSKDPDFFVAYLGGVDKHHIDSKLNDKAKEKIKKHGDAAVVLMLIDANTGAIIWMSTAEATVVNGTVESKKKRLDYAVNKMLSGV